MLLSLFSLVLVFGDNEEKQVFLHHELSDANRRPSESGVLSLRRSTTVLDKEEEGEGREGSHGDSQTYTRTASLGDCARSCMADSKCLNILFGDIQQNGKNCGFSFSETSAAKIAETRHAGLLSYNKHIKVNNNDVYCQSFVSLNVSEPRSISLGSDDNCSVLVAATGNMTIKVHVTQTSTSADASQPSKLLVSNVMRHVTSINQSEIVTACMLGNKDYGHSVTFLSSRDGFVELELLSPANTTTSFSVHVEIASGNPELCTDCTPVSEVYNSTSHSCRAALPQAPQISTTLGSGFQPSTATHSDKSLGTTATQTLPPSLQTSVESSGTVRSTNSSNQTSDSSNPPHQHQSPAAKHSAPPGTDIDYSAAIVGGVVGGVAFVLTVVIVASILLFRRHKNSRVHPSKCAEGQKDEHRMSEVDTSPAVEAVPSAEPATPSSPRPDVA